MSPRPHSVPRRLRPALYLVALLWLVELLNQLEGRSWLSWGLVPRTPRGAVGVLVAPFLHVSPAHLACNTLPLLLLGGLVALRGRAAFWRLTATLILGGGGLVWLFGRGFTHVGASGLVLGYFGYLVVRGLLERTASSLLVTVLVVLLYGGLVWTVLPGQARVSWESHLAGAFTGAAAAWWGVGRRSTQIKG